jgi:histidinol-phosphatase (PHP family)
MSLTGDGHVHTNWSWDTGVPSSNASMDSMCRRAGQIGLPALAFTEHLDVTSWAVEPDDLPERLRPLIGENGGLSPPLLDAKGYLESIEGCRREFPELRILTGDELGQPHLDEGRARQIIDLDALDRVTGHCTRSRPPTSQAPSDPSPTPFTGSGLNSRIQAHLMGVTGSTA